MTVEYRHSQWWDVKSETEAWQKVISADQDSPEETQAAHDAILMELYLRKRAALEIGCGVGRLMKAMSPHFNKVFGIDASPSMVEYAKKNLAGTKNCWARICDGATIPFVDDGFDFVYSFLCFQHLHTLEIIQNYIAEAYRVLEPGGVVRIQTVQGESYVDPVNGNSAYLFQNPNDFVQLFKDAGFEHVCGRMKLFHEHYIWVTGVKP